MMAGNGIAYVAACLAGSWLLRRKALRPAESPVAVHLAKVIGAAAVAGTLSILTALGIAALTDDGKGSSLIQVAAGGLVLAAVYLGTTVMIRVSEAQRVIAAFRLHSSRAARR